MGDVMHFPPFLRFGSVYIDPMILLEPGSVAGLIHLAPLEPVPATASTATGSHAM
jgi:hypothetical protein